MAKIYRPQWAFLKSIWIIFGILLLAFLLLGLTSATATTGSIVKGMSVLTLFYLVFPALATFFTYIALDDKKIKALKWLFSRTKILVSQIESIRCQKSFVGLFTDINISYLNQAGELHESSVGTLEAYGDQTVGEIFAKLVEANPSIKFDTRAEALMKKYASRG